MIRVLLVDDNLLWLSRFQHQLRELGFEPIPGGPNPENIDADVAIVNLSSRGIEPKSLVQKLHEKGMRVVGHAGHKEKELLSLGKEAGCDVLATNGQISHKLQEVLKQALSSTTSK